MFFIGSYAGYRIGFDDARSDEERGYITALFRKILLFAVVIFLVYAPLVVWICRNQSDHYLLIALLLTGFIVIYLLTTFVCAVGSVRTTTCLLLPGSGAGTRRRFSSTGLGISE